MKKLFAFLLFTLHLLSPVLSQDTIVWRNGAKMTVKILGLDRGLTFTRIVFNGPLPGDTDVYLHAANVSYIHYANGSIVMFHSIKPPKLYPCKTLTISFGQGRPLGSFSSSEVNPQSAPNQARGYAYGNSFADPGGLFNAELNLPIHKSCIGTTISLGYNGNGFDGNNFTNFYIPEQNSSIQTSATASSYSIITLLYGMTYTATLGKFAFTVKVLAGPLFCNAPSIAYNQTTPYNLLLGPGMYTPTASIVTDSITSGSNVSLAIKAGLGISYRFSNNVYLTAECDYLYSQTNISVTTKIWEDSGGQLSFKSLVSTSTSSITIPISLLNLSFGLKFLL